MGIVINKTLISDTEIWLLYNFSFKNITYVFQIFKNLKIIRNLPAIHKTGRRSYLAHAP